MKNAADNTFGKDAAKDLLKRTSRSFYRTIAVLPRGLRGPIGLAYLAARATDTVADSPHAPATDCLCWLNWMRHDVDLDEGMQAAEPLLELAAAHAGEHAGEADLLEHWADLVEAIRLLKPADRGEVRQVLAIIITGQILDLKRFGKPNPSGSLEVRALETADEMKDYTYKVAGCVGEFWTRLCGAYVRDYARHDQKRMLRLGRKFGEGLQMVNILRDVVKDARLGRCYLPRESLEDMRIAPADLVEMTEKTYQRLEPILQECRHVAYLRLEKGWRYTLANNKWRLRLACALPVLLGFATLKRLEQADRESFIRGVKVPRSEATKLIRKATVLTPSRPLLRRLRVQIHQRTLG